MSGSGIGYVGTPYLSHTDAVDFVQTEIQRVGTSGTINNKIIKFRGNISEIMTAYTKRGYTALDRVLN